MAALLKSGKFIRMVTGLARPGQNQSIPTQQQSLLPINNTTSAGNSGPTLGEKGGGLDTGGHVVQLADANASFQTWSLTNLQHALPVLAGASQTEDDRETKKDPLLSHLIDKQKVEEFCNKTWSETQKELVELEKELESERKALENKSRIEPNRRESTLKSNALFTKSRKKKVSSRRKITIQKNKELGRPISLNIIYEEPSHTQLSTEKNISNAKENEEIAEVRPDDENRIELHKEPTPNKLSIKDECSDTDNIDITYFEAPTSKDQKGENAFEENKDQSNASLITSGDGDIQLPEKEGFADSYLAPPDDNWESRLPPIELSAPSKPNGELAQPIASGVYYSEAQKCESDERVDTLTESQPQPPDITCVAPSDYVPMVQVFEMEPYTQAHWYPLETVCQTFRGQGRYWDLEILLDGCRGIRAEDRQTIYFWTLQAYADAGMFERAVALSGQLHLEGLGVNFPAYHQLMSSFAAAQQSFAPTLPYSSYAYTDSAQLSGGSYISLADGMQTDISSQTGNNITPSDVSLISTPRSSCPPTPCPQPVDEHQPPFIPTQQRRRSQPNYRGDRKACASARSTPRSSAERKVSAAAANSVAQHLQRRFKKALGDKNLQDCLAAYYQMERLNSKHSANDANHNYNKTVVNVTDSSALIELLVKENQVTEATKVAEGILASDAYPIPKIFRFLLNRLASNGDVESMSKFDKYLTPRVKKEVSFDNRLCNAYLAAGRGSQYLQMLQREVDEIISIGKTREVDPSNIQSVKDKFPRGGAMGLLESDPQLVESFTTLSYKFAELGYIAPMNVLWTYHFIGGRHDIATPLWQEYVQGCPQIMFQKVCQTARSTCNADLAQRLVNVLEDASTVTMGARGIAYSCLIDVLTEQQNYIAGVHALKQGLNTGITLEDVNRTALKRLKQGLEETTNESFPYEIPKKDVKTEAMKSFKASMDERYESDNSLAMIQ